ncbi:MAG: helicase RepA family protein [Clostridiales Family XIII bacterium]|jgi:RecA-family ATPase|nr:helicase RepA family protein [Clostridiales Family XIII bacterium]
MEQKMNDTNHLQTVSASELYDTVYEGRKPIIDGLLYAGTYLFAGSPKVGKSFFMAQTAYHISAGVALWDYPVHPGSVLYLALEDDHARLQQRLFRMFGIGDNDHLHFAVCANRLGNGLDEQLDLFLKEHADTRLIIIDTLGQIREVGGERYSYANDYEIINQIKRFSDRYGICILIVHHTRKQASDDCFDTISGTNGLLGAADGAFILQKEKRTDNKAVLDVVGRDQQDQRLYIEFDRERCIWQFTKAETELWNPPPDPLLAAVAEMVSESVPEWCGSASELSALVGQDISANALSRRLNVSADRLLSEYHVRYENSRNHAGRQISLTLVQDGKAGA